jgi:hypothetical protein
VDIHVMISRCCGATICFWPLTASKKEGARS